MLFLLVLVMWWHQMCVCHNVIMTVSDVWFVCHSVVVSNICRVFHSVMVSDLCISCMVCMSQCGGVWCILCMSACLYLMCAYMLRYGGVWCEYGMSWCGIWCIVCHCGDVCCMVCATMSCGDVMMFRSECNDACFVVGMSHCDISDVCHNGVICDVTVWWCLMYRVCVMVWECLLCGVFVTMWWCLIYVTV